MLRSYQAVLQPNALQSAALDRLLNALHELCVRGQRDLPALSAITIRDVLHFPRPARGECRSPPTATIATTGTGESAPEPSRSVWLCSA